MPQLYYMVLTTVGAAKKANKEALGQSLQLTELAVGDGSGAYVAPDQTWVALNNEVDRIAINQIYQDPDNSTYLVVEAVIPQNIPVGYYIREVGVFDIDGDMIMVGAFPQTYKPTLAEGAARDLYIRAISEIGSTASVELKIDPSIVLSTRKYADDIVEKLRISAQESQHGLVKLIHPDQSKGLQELQKQGVYPSSFNQQWGGMGFGGLPDGSMGEIATGHIKGGSGYAFVANSVGNTYTGQGFKVGQNTDVNSVWIAVAKNGNPTNNLELHVYDDVSDSPNAVITNGTATSISGKQFVNSSKFIWIKFAFAINPSLEANTQYHIVIKSSGAVDAANYWEWKNGDPTYPHGNRVSGNATPVWTTEAGNLLFLIEPTTTILNTGLPNFDGAIHHYESAPLNQSGGFYFSNEDLNHKRGMFHLAGTGWNKDKTFFDSGIGTDNNRIVLRCNITTGYAQVDLYEDNGTKHTVTGITDLSVGNHIVSVAYRTEADGADYLKLYVDGVSEGVPISAATIALEDFFLKGHSILGGGFPTAPTWTQDLNMSVLPSAAGFTYAGTAIEANAFNISNGILYQNGAGYGSLETGYYEKTTTLNNAAGWVVESELKVLSSTNLPTTSPLQIQLYDGSKRVTLYFHEYFLFLYNGSNIEYIQADLTKKNNIKIVGKGSDCYLYINNKLEFDGTGFMSITSILNNITLGDTDATASYNATAEWHSFKYYEGAYLPEYSTLKTSELAYWSENKSSLLSTIYNAGSIQSIKTLAGMSNNYIRKKKQAISVKGVTKDPSTASTTGVQLPELSVFHFGENIYLSAKTNAQNNTASGGCVIKIQLDEEDITTSSFQDNVAGIDQSIVVPTTLKKTHNSLHYSNALYNVGLGTVIATGPRELSVEAE